MNIILILLNLILIFIVLFRNQIPFHFFENKDSSTDDVKTSSDKERLVENKKLHKEIKSLRAEFKVICEAQSKTNTQIADMSADICKVQERISLTDRELTNLKSYVCATTKNSTSEHNIKNVTKEESNKEIKTEVTFLKNFKNGFLSECVEQYAQYKIVEIRGDNASFCFCGDVATAIATKDSTFDGVCELIGWHSNIKTLKTLEFGQIKMCSDGRWSVVKPVRIKCE